MTPPDVGHPAPDFTLPASQGQTVSLSALRGKKVVLYFYPKDMTPGCTVEAEGFRDLHPDFVAAQTVVIGVSRDPVKKHDQFCEQLGLPFTLVADTNGDLCQRYGVWVEKSMYGRTSMGIQRSTFLIQPDGTIARVWSKVKVTGHAAEVLKAAQTL